MKVEEQVIRNLGLMCALAVLCASGYAQQAQSPAGGGGQPAAAGSTMTPVQRADSAPKGTLKNPYKDTDAAVVKASFSPGGEGKIPRLRASKNAMLMRVYASRAGLLDVGQAGWSVPSISCRGTSMSA